MGVEEEEGAREIRDRVLEHLPAVPETTKNFLRRAAAASSSSCCGSVGSVPSAATSAPSVSSGSGRVLTGTNIEPSASPVDADADEAVTAKNSLRRAAAAASSPSCGSVGSVPSAETLLPDYFSTSAPSVSSGSARIPTGTDIEFSTSPFDADADEDEVRGGIPRDATAVVSEPRGMRGSPESACRSRPASRSCHSRRRSCGIERRGFCSVQGTGAQSFARDVISLIFRYLPIRDVFKIGYLFSRRWLEVWQGIPLIMHDVQLGSDKEREIMLTGDRITMNLAKKVSRVLDLHPGPIELFRVDCSSWKEESSLQWRVWVHKLINKNIKEIIICGRWPRSLEPLPNNLAHCSSLQTMHLSFFSVPSITDSLSFPHLKELGLSYCALRNADLDSILRNSKLLKLTLGCIDLDILRIGSETIRCLRMWDCSIDFLCLNGMPNLLFFLQEPSWDFEHRTHLQLRGLPELRVINTIFLNQQSIELCGYHIKADMLDYPLCWSVIRLELVLSFSSENEAALVPSLLKCFPRLQNLRISRLDSHESYQGPTIDWQRMLSTVPCIKTSLIKFALCNCRGDGVENDLANVVLACATKLKDIHIELHPSFL